MLMCLKTGGCMLMLLACLTVDAVRAQNIDPNNDGSQFAWTENVGWINAAPAGCGGCGVEVNDYELTGYMWGENIGWISLSCENTSSCDQVRFGVANDTYGNLWGLAWAENVGWINFAPSTAGVQIDPATGEFSGHAWGENVGWVVFGFSGPTEYRANTAWRCDPNPGPVGNTLQIAHHPGTGVSTLTWTPLPPPGTHYNSYRGTIASDLPGGSYFPYDHACLESSDSNGDGETTTQDSATPSPGTGFYYLVSAEAECEGPQGTASNGIPRSTSSSCPTPP